MPLTESILNEGLGSRVNQSPSPRLILKSLAESNFHKTCRQMLLLREAATNDSINLVVDLFRLPGRLGDSNIVEK